MFTSVLIVYNISFKEILLDYSSPNVGQKPSHRAGFTLVPLKT